MFLILYQRGPERPTSTNESQTILDLTLTNVGNQLQHCTFSSPELRRTLPKRQLHKGGLRHSESHGNTRGLAQFPNQQSSSSLSPFKLPSQNQHCLNPCHLQGDVTASTKTELLRTFIPDYVVTRAITVASFLGKSYLLHFIGENTFPSPRWERQKT